MNDKNNKKSVLWWFISICKGTQWIIVFQVLCWNFFKENRIQNLQAIRISMPLCRRKVLMNGNFMLMLSGLGHVRKLCHLRMKTFSGLGEFKVSKFIVPGWIYVFNFPAFDTIKFLLGHERHNTFSVVVVVVAFVLAWPIPMFFASRARWRQHGSMNKLKCSVLNSHMINYRGVAFHNLNPKIVSSWKLQVPINDDCAIEIDDNLSKLG